MKYTLKKYQFLISQACQQLEHDVNKHPAFYSVSGMPAYGYGLWTLFCVIAHVALCNDLLLSHTFSTLSWWSLLINRESKL